jgi:MFS family permease
MNNLGAIIGPLLGILLAALSSVRGAILLSVIPGLLAAGAILYAIRQAPKPERREHQPIRIRIRPVLHGPIRTLMLGIGAFELRPGWPAGAGWKRQCRTVPSCDRGCVPGVAWAAAQNFWGRLAFLRDDGRVTVRCSAGALRLDDVSPRATDPAIVRTSAGGFR